MPKAPYFDAAGKKASVELAEELFAAKVNVGIMHEVVRAQLAAARSGTHSTKTRAEVRGGGRKPWRQKGTGRARHGSIREPQWMGGGVAHGPKPRDHSFRVNRKVKAAALRSALTDRANEDKIVVVDFPGFDEPETARAVELLQKWGAEGRTLLVIDPTKESEEINAWKSFRNLPKVDIATYPTTYSVLRSEVVVFTRSALDRLSPKEGAADANGARSDAAEEGDAA
jgi:large subunit ribosomal protein L4